MKFKTSKCPKCGGAPYRVLEKVLLTIPIVPSEQREAHFVHCPNSDSTIDWDSSEPELSDEGEWTVFCEEGHGWETEEISNGVFVEG